ncbi:MAG TPA: hypothetical protein VES65_11375 [Solirubrobacteraceae bacterium]|nr:hypothetical protein [Solirubrobacteraceae bacterium]
MSGYLNEGPSVPTVLGVATAVAFAAGVPGATGAASDTLVYCLIIRKNGVAATVTFNGGMRDHTNAQDTTHYVYTGSTTADTIYYFEPALLNTAGPLQVTASVANTAIITTRAA